VQSPYEASLKGMSCYW